MIDEGIQMKSITRWLVVCGCLLCLLYPVQAFEITSLAITLDPSGNAVVGIDYALAMSEKIGVYLGIADPGLELKKALESNFHHGVTIQEVSDHAISFKVDSFTRVREGNGSVLMTTPELRFPMAEKIVAKYWFAPLLHLDFSPQVTRITYPDGYEENFSNLEVIPSTSHSYHS